jgi:hypothetical protein
MPTTRFPLFVFTVYETLLTIFFRRQHPTMLNTASTFYAYFINGGIVYGWREMELVVQQVYTELSDLLVSPRKFLIGEIRRRPNDDRSLLRFLSSVH